MGPGDAIQFQTPEGLLCKAAIPAGMTAGSHLVVELPNAAHKIKFKAKDLANVDACNVVVCFRAPVAASGAGACRRLRRRYRYRHQKLGRLS